MRTVPWHIFVWQQRTVNFVVSWSESEPPTTSASVTPACETAVRGRTAALAGPVAFSFLFFLSWIISGRSAGISEAVSRLWEFAPTTFTYFPLVSRAALWKWPPRPLAEERGKIYRLFSNARTFWCYVTTLNRFRRAHVCSATAWRIDQPTETSRIASGY